jgi:ferrochelatase
MEVVYDLDVVAVGQARSLGLPVTRAGTVGAHPDFVAMVADLVAERKLGHRPERCRPDCCQPSP